MSFYLLSFQGRKLRLLFYSLHGLFCENKSITAHLVYSQKVFVTLIDLQREFIVVKVGLHVKVCSHLTSAFVSTSPSKFNIASMVTQTQTHRMGLNPFSASMLI